MDVRKLEEIAEAIDSCNNRTIIHIIKRLCDYRIYCLDNPGYDEAVKKQLGYLGYEHSAE